MKNVRINAKLVKTWLGGNVATPIACLSNDKTITIRTNDVVIIKILGANDKIVNQIRICIPFVKSCGVFAGCIPILMLGNVIAQNDGSAVSIKTPKTSIIFFNISNFIFSPQKRANIPLILYLKHRKNAKKIKFDEVEIWVKY